MKSVSKRLNLSVQYACNREGLPLRADFVRQRQVDVERFPLPGPQRLRQQKVSGT